MGFSLNHSKLICLFFIGLSLQACKLPDIAPTEELVQSSAQDLNKVLLSELEKVDFSKIAKGQYVRYEGNYRAENGNVTKFMESERLVTDIEDYPDSRKIVMAEALRSYDSGGAITEEKISDVIWKFTKEAITVDSFAPSFYFANRMQNSEAKLQATNDDEPIYDHAEYFNLKSRRLSLIPPGAILKRPDCGGIENCRIEALEVSYLLHLVTKEGVVGKRYQFRTIVSAQIPPIFWGEDDKAIWPVVSDCLSYLVGSTYVNQCTVLRDLQK